MSHRCHYCDLTSEAMYTGACPNRSSPGGHHLWELFGAPSPVPRALADALEADRDQLRARIEDYQREVERRDEMLAASDHREAELRAEVERLRGVFRHLVTRVSGSDCPYCTPLNNWGHTVLCPLMRESSGEEGRASDE